MDTLIRIFFSISLITGITITARGQCPNSCIVINEFSVDPDQGANGDADVTGEFIELYNTCDGPVAIGCFVLCMTDNSGGRRGDCITIPTGTTLAAGDVYTMGGYTTNCTGGEVDCDWPGLVLDLNWHSDASSVWSVANDVFYTTNVGNYIGVLADGGEDITLFDNTGAFLWGVQYDGGAGVATSNTENIGAVNGCAAQSVTIPATSAHTDVGNTPGPNGADGGFELNCDGTWSDNQSTSQNPGSNNGCPLTPCSLPIYDVILKADVHKQQVHLSWTSVGTFNKATFIIQRSTSHGKYEEVARYTAEKNQSYYHVDRPHKKEALYRVKAVSKSGSVISNVQKVNLQTSAFTISKKTEGHLIINHYAEEDKQLSVQICNMLGQVIFEQDVNCSKGECTITIPLNKFPATMHLVTIRNQHELLHISKLMQ